MLCILFIVARNFDEYDRLIKSVSDENIITTTTYDNYNNELTSGVANDSKEISSATTYSSDGNYVVSETDELGNTATYQYDSLGNLTGYTNPLGDTTSYTYSEEGNLTGTSMNVSGLYSGTGITNNYTYDAADRLTKISLYGGLYYNFTYDSVGNPLSYYNGMSFSWEMGRQLAGITTDTDTIDK